MKQIITVMVTASIPVEEEELTEVIETLAVRVDSVTIEKVK